MLAGQSWIVVNPTENVRKRSNIGTLFDVTAINFAVCGSVGRCEESKVAHKVLGAANIHDIHADFPFDTDQGLLEICETKKRPSFLHTSNMNVVLS